MTSGQFSRVSCRKSGWVPPPASHGVVLLLLIAFGAVLSGCGGSGAGGAPAALTASPRATPLAPPLTVAVAVTQQGTLAARDARLALAVTITNNTSATVAITNVGCPFPTIAVELRDAAGTTLWQNYARYVACPYFATRQRDVWAVPAGGSLREALTANLFAPSPSSRWVGPAGPESLRAGAAYVVAATVLLWHQGALADIGHGSVLQGRNVSGEAKTTLK